MASSESSIPSPQAAASHNSSKTGAIVGGVFGGLIFLALLALGIFLFLRRRKRKRTPASAEFRDRASPWITFTGAQEPEFGPSPSQEYLNARRYRDGDGDGNDGPPPPFAPGDFNQPVFEKVEDEKQMYPTYGNAV